MSKRPDDVVIVAAARTPIGSFNGTLSSLPAHKLGEIVIRELLNRAKISGGDVSEVILGQILTAGAGGNPARQAAVNSGLPVEVPAWGMNQLCGSGLRAVALGFQAIRNGDSKFVIAGGQESMSQAAHTIQLRNGVKMGPAQLEDSMLHDALIDAFHHYHMGNTAENIAKQFGIDRQEQDEFALASQQKCATAMMEGRFRDEIVPVTIPGRKISRRQLDPEATSSTTVDSIPSGQGPPSKTKSSCSLQIERT